MVARPAGSVTGMSASILGTFGTVASTHQLATAAAMSVLDRGGNAIDAAAAGAFVLHVVEPHLNGPGGDATILVSVRGGTPRVLCGQGPAPTAARAAAYRELGLDLVPGTGPLAAAIPGAVDAWLLALRDHGTWPLADVLASAIDVAERGHFPLARIGDVVERMRAHFSEHWPTSADFYLGAPPRPDRLWRNPRLAATWRRLIDEAARGTGDGDGRREREIDAARRVWKEGFIAEAMVDTARRPTRDSSGADHSGFLTRDDLATWSASWEPTVGHSWGPWTIHKAGPWTQGPAFLQQAALLADVDPVDADAADPALVHRIVEGAKLALADRDAWYGDDAPLPSGLLSDDYTASRRGLVGDTARTDWRPGAPDGVRPHPASHITRLLGGDVGAASDAGAGEPTFRGPTIDTEGVAADGKTRGDTCHIAVTDRWGTVVAATPSGGWLQSNPVIPELGFPLGTRLQMCWLDDGLPNSLVGGRRPRSTLSPTIAEFEGRVTVGFGTPGGDQQDQWTFNTFVRLAHALATTGRLHPQAAIDAPQWHTDHLIASFWPRGFEPASLAIEADAGESVIAGLRSRGHDVRVARPRSLGRVCVVGRDPRSGALVAGASTRGGQGHATGR